ncbi:MAG: type I-C CRISPR-associated protein Cas5c [Desulfuromonadaceae bacterium]|nr:type I-C CRISPR-associated protein Cas5c [Desulfuromonadaceae bacterium]
MLDDRVVRVKVTGDYACFTRPDLKVERMTYPCMTPSAARGVLDSILWKPEFQWYVRRIIVLNPVRFMSIKRNEINSKQGRNPIVVEEKRAQRNSVLLRNVAYIIEASIYMNNATDKRMYEKYVGMTEKREGLFPRRVKKGQCWRRPYLGTREFSAEFMSPEGNEQPIQETIPIGSMLFDIFYDNAGKPQPLFFEAVIRDGVLNCEVPENDQMIRSSHMRPPLGSEVSSAIYEFNRQEEEAV